MKNSSQRRWDDFYIGMAEYVSRMSKDPSTKTGAVIVDPRRRVVSVGFNGLPRGVEGTDERLQNRDLKYQLIVHCELFAERSLVGCTLYTWPFMSCSVCAAMVIQSGITRCVAPYSDNPRWADSFRLTTEMFNEAGVALDLIHD